VPTTDWLPLVVTGLLSGGAGSAVAAIVTARAASRRAKLDERAQPAQIESTFLGGAEKAVQALALALDRAQAEINDLKRERDEERLKSREKDRRIQELETLMSDMRKELDRLSGKMEQARTLVDEVKAESAENPPG
jgi:chromosome segregation ATPase